MNRCRKAAGAAGLALVVVIGGGCAGPQQGSAFSVGPRAAPPLEQTYADVIDVLLPGMGHEEIVKRQDAQLAFEKICLRAGAPGEEARRRAVCQAMAAKLRPETPLPARVWLLRKLEPLGREEVVPTLATVLGDGDEQIRELARRALQNNPAPAAAKPLRDELAATTNDEWRVALINALAFRKDAASVELLADLARSENVAVAAAAIAALGDIAGADALAIIRDLRRTAPPALRDRVTEAYVRCAESLQARGKTGAAAAIYEELCASAEPRHVQFGALNGLAETRQYDALPLLIRYICGDDEEFRLHAVQLTAGVRDKRATERLTTAMESAPAAGQVGLLTVLSLRGDPAALPTVVRAVHSHDPRVRVAAVSAIGVLGDSGSVALLAEVAGTGGKSEAEAARAALVALGGGDVNRTMLDLQARTTVPQVRTALLNALSDRCVQEAVPAFLQAATAADEGVRVAALKALRVLGTPQQVPQLLELLAAAQDETTRKAVEDAVATIVSRDPNKEKRTEPLVTTLWRQKDPGAQASLIRVLGRLQGKGALLVVRASCASPHEAVRDAAVRALAGWSEPVVLMDLLDLAGRSENETHRVLALRGFVRLVRLPSERAAPATLDLLKQAMPYAARVEDKKLVLSALKDVACIEALDYALSFLGDADLQAEAVAAGVDIAKAVCGVHPAEAVAGLERMQSIAAAGSPLRAAVEEALAAVRTYCVNWVYAGPYRKEGKKGDELADLAFPPENPQASDVAWQPLPVSDPEQPWAFDLAKAGVDSNCCLYARTRVWSEQAQPAKLLIGSDDGVLVWLNGKQVHRADTARPLSCGEDRVSVTLESGWNTLLLKVVQGGGASGLCAGVQAEDGSVLPGLKFSPE
ncbi:MAG TPA: HEAT repeat domain-containing protein [Phycisphaerae bacterium]|nr:HEAT repeat domain-containing protein [Phycisphaerae bacterium]HNU45485.1 HEAT repeat domain-containing protein [Phycisphaerae bacterium]